MDDGKNMLYLHNNEVVKRPDSVSLLIPIEGTDPEWEALNSPDEFYAITIENPSEQELEQANYYALPDQPEHDPVWQICVWVRNEWTIIPSDAAKLRDKMWENILKTRQDLLYSTDHLVYEYTNMSEENIQLWKAYRQSLRDITQYRTGEIDDWKLVVLPKSPYQDTYDENGGTGE